MGSGPGVKKNLGEEGRSEERRAEKEKDTDVLAPLGSSYLSLLRVKGTHAENACSTGKVWLEKKGCLECSLFTQTLTERRRGNLFYGKEDSARPSRPARRVSVKQEVMEKLRY